MSTRRNASGEGSGSTDGFDPLYHLMTAVFEAKAPASVGAPFEQPPVTFRSLIASLKPAPPFNFVINPDRPFQDFEKLLTECASVEADDDAAAPSFNEPSTLVKAVRKALQSAGAFEMIERFSTALEKARGQRETYSSTAVARMMAEAMHDPADLEDMETDDFLVNFSFPSTSVSNKSAICDLFDVARTALLESGTFVNDTAFKSTYKKCRAAMIVACTDMHLKQQVVSTLPKAIAVDEECVIARLAVFREARRTVTRYFADLHAFTPQGRAKPPPAQAAQARAAPAATADGPDMTLDGGAPHVRRRAETAKKSGISKFSVLHMDCQSAAKAPGIIKPICSDQSKLDWTRQNCQGSMGAAVFVFCDDGDLVEKIAQGFAKFQDENIDTENFGTPFLDTISTTQSIYLTSHLVSTPSHSRRARKETPPAGFRVLESDNGSSQRGQLVRLRHPRPAWADEISAGKQKERHVTFTTPTAQQTGAQGATATAVDESEPGQPGRVANLLEQRTANNKRRRAQAKEEGRCKAAAATKLKPARAAAKRAARATARAASAASARDAEAENRANASARGRRRALRRHNKKARRRERRVAAATAEAAVDPPLRMRITWPSGDASQLMSTGEAPVTGSTVVIDPCDVPAADLAMMRTARGWANRAGASAAIIGAMGITVGRSMPVTAVVACTGEGVWAAEGVDAAGVSVSGGLHSLPCAGAAKAGSSIAREGKPPIPLTAGVIPAPRVLRPTRLTATSGSAGRKGVAAALDGGMAEHGACVLAAAAIWSEAVGSEAIEAAQSAPPHHVRTATQGVAARANRMKAKRRTFNKAAARELPLGEEGLAADMGAEAAAAVAAACAEEGAEEPSPKCSPPGYIWRINARVQARTGPLTRWTNATVTSSSAEATMVRFADSKVAVAVTQVRYRTPKARKVHEVALARAATAAEVAKDDGVVVAQGGSILPPKVSTRVQVRIRCEATAKRWLLDDLQIDAARIDDNLCTGASISAAGKGIYVHVANLSDRPIAVADGMRLGTAYRVQIFDCPDAAAAPAMAVGEMDKETAAPNEFSQDDEPMEERVAQANYGPDAPAQRVAELKSLVRRFPDLVSNQLRQTHRVTAAIPTKPGCTPAYTRPYRLSKYEKGVLEGEVDRMIKIGALEDSTSDWCSPMLLVSKKPLADGSSAGFRCVSDFRELNGRLTHIEQFPLPDVREMMESLEGSAVFSACDALHGFWGIPVRAEDRHKLAFQVGDRNLQYKVLPMGVASSSAIFQKFTTATFARCPHTRIFVDDLLVASPTWEQHMHDLEQAFEAADAAGLTFKPKKLFLGYSKLRYLGYDISADGVVLGEDTIAALSEKPPPTSTKEAQRLLGLANWARTFLVGFSNWMEPIMRVARPKHKWSAASWGTEQKAAFEELKRQLARRTQLSHPTTAGKLRLFTDASTEALGAVLTQWQEGKWVPLGFHSRRCSPAESHYSPSCLEAAAVLEGLRRWRSILHGPARASGEPRVEIITDHSALTQVTMNMEKSPQLARWKAALEEFSYKITHRAGIKMAFVDYFSRSPHAQQGKWRDSTFNDTLNHATDYLQSEKRFTVAAAHRAGAVVRDSTDAIATWADGSRSAVTVLVDSGAQINLTASADMPAEACARATTSGIWAVEGVGKGSTRIQGTAAASVRFCEDSAEQAFQAEVQVLNSESSVDRRAHLILSAAFLDRHGISRIGGARPYICCNGRRLATLRSTHVGGKPAVAAATRSSAPLAGPTQRSKEDFKKEALPGIVEFKDAQRRDPTWMAAEAWADDKDAASALLAPLPKKVVTWVKQRKFTHDENGLLLAAVGDEEAQLCLPGSLRPTVLHVFHDAAGHWDHASTAKSIARSFSWPGLAADVRDYVESCALCRSRFVSTRGLHAQSGFPEEPEENFAAWHCDLAGPIRLKGDNEGDFYVLGFICRKSRWVEATVIQGKQAATTARSFVEGLVRRYGSPVTITSDSGKEFMGDFAATLKELGISHHMSTPLHHTGNSIIERFWRSMWDRAALTVPEDRIDWGAVVHAAASFHNMHAPGKSTASPFEAVFHQAPRSALDATWRPLALPFNKEVNERIEEALGIRRRDQQRRRSERAKRAEGGRRAALKKTFAVGDAVWALRSPPAEDVVMTTAKLLCRMAPGNVTKVVDGSANRYGVTFCDNGRYVERHIDHLRDRASRARLLREWDCEPLNSDRDEPGCDMVNPAADTLMPAAPRQLRSPKKGMVVVVAQEFAKVPGLHHWAVPSRPLPIIGTVTATAPGSETVTIKWMANAAGGREPNSRVELRASRCLSPFSDDSFKHRRFPVNSWAPYTGPSLEDKPRLLALIYRNGQTTFNGRPVTKWRARGVGSGPDGDILFESEDKIKELFPDDDVDTLMRRFVAHAERVST